MPGLPALAGRLLALGILLGVLALAWFGIGQPVLAEREATRAQIEQTRELVARYQAINAGRQDLEATIEHWREVGLPQSGIFPGSSPPVVAADLQRVVSDVVKASGGELLSIQILPERAEPELDAAAVRVQFRADVETVTQVFYGLESAKPYLFLDNLQIRAGGAARSLRIARLRDEASPEQLLVSCDVFGYLRRATS